MKITLPSFVMFLKITLTCSTSMDETNVKLCPAIVPYVQSYHNSLFRERICSRRIRFKEDLRKLNKEISRNIVVYFSSLHCSFFDHLVAISVMTGQIGFKNRFFMVPPPTPQLSIVL
ncbi:hypothetical protein Tcan_00726, partial [Toxocara canis]